jgi:hypothetical protein
MQGYDEEKLKLIYQKVVQAPNINFARKGFIKCPNCGEEILMVPTLRIMNQAIETHIDKHKEQLKADPIKEHETAIFIRLSLMRQVLGYTCKQKIR